MSYELGDVAVEALSMVSGRGVVDLSPMTLELSVYESVFTPGIVVDVVVVDSQDVMGSLRLSGDETLALSLSVPGSTRSSWLLAVSDVSSVRTTGAQKGKTYEVQCVSKEALMAKTNYVTKGYHAPISDIVSDVTKTYLKSEKVVVLEATSGAQDVVVPNLSPYEAIQMLTRRAVSPTNRSSSYSYFESTVDGVPTISFVTIESLFSGPLVKEFKRSDALNAAGNARRDDNVLAMSSPRQLSSIDRVSLGLGRRVITYNHTTQAFDTSVVRPEQEPTFGSGGSGSMDSADFASTYGSDAPAPVYVPRDWNQRAETGLADAAAGKASYLAALVQNSIKVRVIGDTVLRAGARVVLHVPGRSALTGASQEDPLMSGDFVVSRLRHRVGQVSDRPRFTTTMELVKAGYAQGVA